MKMPRWLFLFWRRRIFLRSTGWYLTRKRIFRQQGEYCQRCGTKYNLNVHHVDHSGQPKPKWWHFLPLARFVMFTQDYSRLMVFCGYHHMQEEIRLKGKKK